MLALNRCYYPSLILIFMHIEWTQCKIYERCELARELRDVHEIPDAQLATWVCIARHESEFNTSATNQGSGDHGLFQISQLFWCSPPGYACGVSCESLRDDDIEDDVICARRVFREHRRLSGDGFNAWVVYAQYCRDPTYVASFLDNCSIDGLRIGNVGNDTTLEKPLPTVNYYPQFTRRTSTISVPSTDTTSEEAITVPTNLEIKSKTTVKVNKESLETTKKPEITAKQSTRTTPITTTESIKSSISTNHPKTTTTSTPKGTTQRLKSTTKSISTKTPFKSITPQNGGGIEKRFKATEENDKFRYAISRTGYIFTRYY